MSSFSLSLPQVEAVSWTITGVALLFTGGRFWIRWRYQKGFHGDDVAHAVATIMMVVHVAILTGVSGLLERMLAWEHDPQQYPRPDNLQDYEVASNIAGFVLVIALWAVKMNYMLLYRHIFGVSAVFMKYWWAAMAYQLVTFLACIAGRIIYCGGQPSQLLNWDLCNDHKYFPLMRSIYIFMYVAIVSSDLVTVALPLGMVRGLHMRWSHKASVAGILCLTCVVIAFDTLRLVEAYITGIALNALWQEIELEIAVIISALSAYYSLINLRRSRNKTRTSQSRSMPLESSREYITRSVDIQMEVCQESAARGEARSSYISSGGKYGQYPH